MDQLKEPWLVSEPRAPLKAALLQLESRWFREVLTSGLVLESPPDEQAL